MIVQRGSIHWHGVAKLSNDPNLCKMSKKAIENYLALKALKGELQSQNNCVCIVPEVSRSKSF